uniref:Uncharacterized protein n=1 Tax=Papilio xuthus TaxID=66420 RepID=I4DKJ1_PAPXU|nr:unknown unsecreted protein [Papilio xuthus]
MSVILLYIISIDLVLKCLKTLQNSIEILTCVFTDKICSGNLYVFLITNVRIDVFFCVFRQWKPTLVMFSLSLCNMNRKLMY